MTRSRKFACSIDAGLLQRVEQLRSRTGESRSALVSRALAKLTQDEKRATAIQRYVEAYRVAPETAQEVKNAQALARRVVPQVPWEDE